MIQEECLGWYVEAENKLQDTTDPNNSEKDPD